MAAPGVCFPRPAGSGRALFLAHAAQSQPAASESIPTFFTRKNKNGQNGSMKSRTRAKKIEEQPKRPSKLWPTRTGGTAGLTRHASRILGAQLLRSQWWPPRAQHIPVRFWCPARFFPAENRGEEDRERLPATIWICMQFAEQQHLGGSQHSLGNFGVPAS